MTWRSDSVLVAVGGWFPQIPFEADCFCGMPFENLWIRPVEIRSGDIVILNDRYHRQDFCVNGKNTYTGEIFKDEA